MPTLEDGEVVLVELLTKHWDSLARTPNSPVPKDWGFKVGDVVTMKSPVNSASGFCKRITNMVGSGMALGIGGERRDWLNMETGRRYGGVQTHPVVV